MSLDEDELFKLLREAAVEESVASGDHSAATSPRGETVQRQNSGNTDLERELSAALNEGSMECESTQEREAPSLLGPVTPEDVQDIKNRTANAETGSSGKGKDSSTDESSVEGELHDAKRSKRKAEAGSKSPVKKLKYYETDKTVRQPGWAEKLLKNQTPVLISSKPAPVKPTAPVRPSVTEEVQPVRKSEIETDGREPMVVSNGSYSVRTQRLPGRHLDASAIPPGWMDCPGLEGKWGFFLFSKTPLGERWNHVIPERSRYTPSMILRLAAGRHQPIGLVIDLTNSSLYYDPYEFQRHGVQYCKIRCRGHGATPTLESVNEFWWAVSTFGKRMTGKFILLHCTHGFNRTGFMVAHFTMRWAERDTVNGIIRTFAVRRPPGIYKDEYVQELLDYYHEPRTPKLITPAVPEWKGISQDEAEDESNQIEPSSWVGIKMVSEEAVTADDVIGEQILSQEQSHLQSEILNLVVGKQRYSNRFPGAQPVSMDRNNLELLANKRYWVTYKADGTRYMLLLMNYGVYVINRHFEFQRVQMRFPVSFTSDASTVNPAYPHQMTLLDGEMVIDHDKDKGIYVRKYLVYDLVLHQGESWMSYPWKQRFAKLREIVQLRQDEQMKIEKGGYQYEYKYRDEPFTVEAKLFWCLGQVAGIVKTIPTLKHECDGFIFQAYLDHYKVGTHEDLLKWKYAHMNSVDFRYRYHPTSQNDGEVFLLRKSELLCEGVKVEFASEADKEKYNGKIIECAYDKERQIWTFLRERVDKKQPNAYTVYEKVAKSISDNITQEELMERMLDLFRTSDVYTQDREKLAVFDQ